MASINELNFSLKIKQEPLDLSTRKGKYIIPNNTPSTSHDKDLHNNIFQSKSAINRYGEISESKEFSEGEITCEFESHEAKLSTTEIFANNRYGENAQNKEFSDHQIKEKFESHEGKYSTTKKFIETNDASIYGGLGKEVLDNIKKKFYSDDSILKPRECKVYIHINLVHNKLKPHECKICKKTYGRKTHLEILINSVHKKLKPHECDICHKTFGQKVNLKRHIDLRHNKLKPHECKICNKTFGEKNTLERHIIFVHDKLKPHECKICEKTFGRKNGLEIHINSVHKKIKPQECDIRIPEICVSKSVFISNEAARMYSMSYNTFGLRSNPNSHLTLMHNKKL